MLWRVNPDEEILDWKAVCGRTACAVWREGRLIAFPTPIGIRDPKQDWVCNLGLDVSEQLQAKVFLSQSSRNDADGFAKPVWLRISG
jgi:hypothetical protein